MTRSLQDLKQLQSLPLNLKIDLTKARIRQWIYEFGEDGVYVSFSGGKDSTVLLHIVRSMFSDIPAVFINTGLEYPEIVQFVKTFDNVEIIKPKMNFKKVIEKYGYPFISKEVSESVYEAKKYLTALKESMTIAKDRQTDRLPYAYRYNKLCGIGEFTKHPIQANIPNKDRSMFALTKWKFLLFAPFDVSNKCCNVMKKEPAHRYSRLTGRKPFTAQMAQESRLRTQKWIQNGCNGFNLKTPTSNPLAFWTEQDVLKYIILNNIKIASVYGDIVFDNCKSSIIPGQLKFNIDNSIEEAPCILKTTGCKRTGCMFCGFGCQFEKEGEGRFELMKLTHPSLYEWIMKPCEDGGLNYKYIIDWLNSNTSCNIHY